MFTERIVWPYIITYGNKYVSKERETNKQLANPERIHKCVSAYLEAKASKYEAVNGNLPEDWESSLFWRIENLVPPKCEEILDGYEPGM